MGFSCFYGLQPGLLLQVTEWPGDVCGAISVAYFYLLFLRQVEVLEAFQEQVGDSRQLHTAMSFHENCFSWLSPNMSRLPRENALGLRNDMAMLWVSSGSLCH